MGGSDSVEKPQEVKELERIALDSSADYDRRISPVMDRFIADVRDNRAETQLARNVSTAETASAFGGLRDTVAKSATRAGGNAGLALGNMAADEGTSGGLNMVDTAQAARDRYLQQVGGLVEIGRGERTDAFRGLSGVADVAAQQAATDARNSAANRAALQSGVGLAAGLAASRYEPKKEVDPLAINYGGTLSGPQSGIRTVYNGGP